MRCPGAGYIDYAETKCARQGGVVSLELLTDDNSSSARSEHTNGVVW